MTPITKRNQFLMNVSLTPLKNIVLIFMVVALIAASGCVSVQTSPVSGKSRLYGYSWQEELKLGQEADSEIIAQYGLYDDPELSAYVSRLGEELLKVSHFNRADTPDEYKNTAFTFRVLNSPVVNAFALPGGFVYVTRGLLNHLNNEAQLMVVLGHEIGHVAARHASQRAAEQQLGQFAMIGGAVLGQSLGYDGGKILQLSGTTAQLLFLSYGREDERESDQLGVEYAAMEGYNAAEGAKFFTSLKRISEKSGASIPSHLSSHPDPGEREENIPELAAEWAQEGYTLETINEDEYLNMISGLMYGQNPREGFVEDDIFYHPDLAFLFPIPSGFQVINQPTAVILVNEAQDAIVQFSIDSQSDSPKAAVSSFMGQEGFSLQAENALRVHGFEGYEAEATTTTEDGSSITLNYSAVEYAGNIYTFLSYSSTESFASYKNRFNAVVTGFDELKDQSKLTVEPVRIQLVRVRESAPFRSFLPNRLPMGIEPLDVAILNQVELDEAIPRGRTLKIPKQ